MHIHDRFYKIPYQDIPHNTLRRRKGRNVKGGNAKNPMGIQILLCLLLSLPPAKNRNGKGKEQ
jgi:hypothetical protein